LIGYLKKVAIRNVVSPYGLALVSFAVFLVAWAAPPSLFMEYAGEPDILYLNPVALSFYGCCVLLFVAGARTFEVFRPQGSVAEPRFSSGAPLRFLLVPLGVSTLLCAASVVVLNGKVSNLAGLFFSQQGALIKLANASGQAEEGSWGYVLTFHTGMLWWAYSRSQQLRMSNAFRVIFRCCFAVAIVVGIVTALIKVDRTNLIPIISGIFIIYLYSRLAGREISLSRLLGLSGGLAAALLATFAAISYIRGASDARLLMVGVFGYTAASYNRLAAELNGLLHYSFGGRGIYLSNFVAFNNTINRIIPFNQLMGGPTARGVYFSEFSSIAAGGLNPGFNWSGAFGYLYADLGWWTPVYLFPVGMLNAYLWRAFRARSVAGIVLYPWAAFSILFWFGWNVLFDLRFALLLVVAAAMGTYEACLLGRRTAPVPVTRELAL
jgi:hypothetical protein